MELLRSFNKLSKSDTALAGGKGASLGEMTKAGIPVPPGFVILADAFERFIEETDINVEIDAILDKVKHERIDMVEHVSEKIKAFIMQAEMPKDIATAIVKNFEKLESKFVAVRSSATAEDSSAAAWAGQLESYLNTTEKTLLKNVQRCWASLFTPRAIFYRFEKGLHKQKISVAVVVQKMVESEISGIAFSVHPVTQDRNQLIIEAGFGLGEAIVSGQITPDSYVIEKEPRRIIDKNVSTQNRALYRGQAGGVDFKELTEKEGAKQALTDNEILKLTVLILKIEKHYGFPCDIEWAYEKGKFYIVQSRPITTLGQKFWDQKDVKQREGTLEKNVANTKNIRREDYHYFGLWKQEIFSACFWCKWLEASLNQKLELRVSEPGILIMDGHFFVKNKVLTQISRRLEQALLKKDYTFFAKLESAAEAAFKTSLGRTARIDEKGISIINFNNWFFNANKIMFFWVYSFLLSDFMDQQLFKAARKSNIGDNEIVNLVVFRPTLLKKQKEEALKIKQELEKTGLLFEKEFSLQNAIKKVKGNKRLYEKIKKHVEKYSWIETSNLKGSPFTIEKLLEQIKDLTKTSTKMRSGKIHKLTIELSNFLKAAESIAYLRQYSAEIFSMFTKQNIVGLHALAEDLEILYEDMLYVTFGEIKDRLSGKDINLRKLIHQRKGSSYCMYTQGDKTILVDNDEEVKRLYAALIPKSTHEEKILRGITGNKGKARGIARIMLATEDFHKMKRGNVLVTTMTTPDFVLLMQQSSAIVTDVGGLLSHAAIVSRELGKPCVIGTQFATQIIKDGDVVEVDADKGTVLIMDEGDGPAINPNEWEFEFQQRNFQPIIMSDFWCRVLDQRIPVDIKLPNIQIDYLFTTYSKGYVKKRSKSDLLKKIKQKSSDDDYLKYVYYTTLARVENFDKYTQRIAKLVNEKIDRTILSRLWDEFDQEFLKIVPWFFIPWYLTEENYLSDEVKKGLEKYKSVITKITDMNNALMVLLFPVKDTLFQEEQDSYFGLVDRASKLSNFATDTQFKNKAQNYLDRFAWTTTYLLLPLEKMTMVELASRIKKDITAKTTEQYKLQKEARKTNASMVKKLMATLRDDKVLIKKIEWTQEYAWLLTRSVEEGLAATANLIEFFKAIAKAVGVPYKKWVLLTSQEIKNILDGQLKVSDVDLKSREQAYCMLLRSGRIELFTGKQAKELSNFVEENVGKIDASTKTFNGQPTYPGKVKGKVLIAENAQQAGQIKGGEILVTSMTTPDFVPMMKRAAAIITNEGGLLSHAAIVSRELRKPCIVGTKIATKLLKSGDVVEVDAEKGIITIVK